MRPAHGIIGNAPHELGLGTGSPSGGLTRRSSPNATIDAMRPPCTGSSVTIRSSPVSVSTAHTVGSASVRALVQRVSRAKVTVDGEVVGEIGAGLCVLVGVTHDDSDAVARKMADRIFNLRVLADDDGVMNRSLADTGDEVLVVSQFTLYGDTSKGRRPSWLAAAPPEVAEPLVDVVVEALRQLGCACRDRPVPHDDGRRARQRRAGDRDARARSPMSPIAMSSSASATTGRSPMRT